MFDWVIVSLASASGRHRERFNEIDRRGEDLRKLDPNWATFVEAIGLTVPLIYHGLIMTTTEKLMKKYYK